MVLSGRPPLSSFAGLELRDYYAAACPHCKHLEPAWRQAAAEYSGPVKFRQVECADENWAPVGANQKLCKGIGGYPTIKLFNGDEEVAEYSGDRTAASLKAFAEEHEKVTAAAAPAALCLAPAPVGPRQARRRARTSGSAGAGRRAAAAAFL
ncbi:unnamed protein product [Prorocentrum cordatum]|uniref:Thioredoxin domain-containing protein n=1 Tax=Prorocentrum cordatum TaxID=2364126 RepID=A0ABN9X928_9DINO|nr:unnamed protein product [Polarella glacialis]